MSRTPFDQFAKQFFESFLAPLGEVQTNFEVPGEPKFIDIWFSPSNQHDILHHSQEALNPALKSISRLIYQVR